MALLMVIIVASLQLLLPRSQAVVRSPDIKTFTAEKWVQESSSCEPPTACLIETKQLLEKAEERIQQRGIGAENLFYAVQQTHQALSAIERAGGSEEIFMRAQLLHNQAKSLLETAAQGAIFGVKRAIRLRKYDQAMALSQRLRALFPLKESFGYQEGLRLRKLVERCRRKRGRTPEC
ncbi:MAG: hypothetical protein KTR25_16610 [Myxococcales bacterium]|nr:hypothetical protein [Myxococcales bacterium]